jgi:hypothetical protein
VQAKVPIGENEPERFPEGDSLPPPGRSTTITRDEAKDAINDLFHRAMKDGDAKKWMAGLLTFIANMRRYSIFNAKLIFAQRPGAVAVGTPRYWADRGRTIRPGAMPIVILVPRGPFCLVYEYEDTEGLGVSRTNPHIVVRGQITSSDWGRLATAAERDGKTAEEPAGFFRVMEEGLGYARAGDVHHRRDSQGRFVIRINSNLSSDAKWTTLVHELGHVYCGHAGPHPRAWWPDRQRLPGIHSTMQRDIKEFEAEAVAWIVASRAGIETSSADYLASRVAPLDNERVDIDAILRSANHIEALAPTATLKAFRRNE